MKISSDKKETFVPFSVNIHFDTSAEANEFYAVFNHTTITDNTPNIDDTAIRELVQKKLGESFDYRPSWDNIFNAIHRKDK